MTFHQILTPLDCDVALLSALSGDQTSMAKPLSRTTHRKRDVLAAHLPRIAHMILEARERKGWTQSDLAREIYGEVEDSRGYMVARNRGYITKWESGESLPKPQIIPMIAEALDLDVSEMQQARSEAELGRKSQLIPTGEYSAGSVPGHPELVMLSLKAVIRLDSFAEIISGVAQSNKSARELAEQKEREKASRGGSADGAGGADDDAA